MVITPKARRAEKTPSHVGRREEATRLMGFASATLHDRTSLPDIGPGRYTLVAIVHFPGPLAINLIAI